MHGLHAKSGRRDSWLGRALPNDALPPASAPSSWSAAVGAVCRPSAAAGPSSAPGAAALLCCAWLLLLRLVALQRKRCNEAIAHQNLPALPQTLTKTAPRSSARAAHLGPWARMWHGQHGWWVAPLQAGCWSKREATNAAGASVQVASHYQHGPHGTLQQDKRPLRHHTNTATQAGGWRFAYIGPTSQPHAHQKRPKLPLHAHRHTPQHKRRVPCKSHEQNVGQVPGFPGQGAQ